MNEIEKIETLNKMNRDFLEQLLKGLSREIPHKWRVQSFSKHSPVATLVPYIDSRDAMDLLDEVAVLGWHREHLEIADNVYCRIGIVFPDTSIMWRSDVGIESQADPIKGESSDAFKRSGVCWGIGRFLYRLGMKYAKASEVKTNSNYPYIVDDKGKKVYDITKFVNDGNACDNFWEVGKPVKSKPKPVVQEPQVAENKDWQKIMKAFAKIDVAKIVAEQIELKKVNKNMTAYPTMEGFCRYQDKDIISKIHNKLKGGSK